MPSLKEVIAQGRKLGYAQEKLISLLKSKGYSDKEIKEALGVSQKQEMYPPSQGGDYSSIFNLITHPKEFFRDDHHHSIILPVTIHAVVFVIYIIWFFILNNLINQSSNSYPSSLSYFSFAFVGIAFFISLMGIFIFGSSSHVLAKWNHGDGNYKTTLSALLYCTLPITILAFVPILGIFAGIIYGLFLFVIAMREEHHLTTGKAALVALLPIGIFVGIIIGLILLIISTFRNGFM